VTVDRFVADSFALPRLVGNSVFGAMVRARTSAGSTALMRHSAVATLVQRCGATACDCTDEERAARTAPAATSPAQRDEDDDAPRDPGATPAQAPTAAAGTFNDNITVSVKQVPIAVRQNALDFNNAVHTGFGGEGGRTGVVGAAFRPDEDNSGKIAGATLNWTVAEEVPTVARVAGSAITDPNAKAESDARNALAGRVAQHEAGHATREQQGRTGFARSLKGVSDSKIDAMLKALECRVGGSQRSFDNQEGSITLSSNNTVTVSGIDHPEYVQGCP
jgi:hypothetical protein